ncbi:hypothetical protein DPX16_5375 [Anabarilius grahami]|uniref:Uncharacterized protein n=1 Tax=Anabarilius grahami TaxID=495550 RepID=A0A3N0Y4Y0_ANAGA|nr:hypothetical protein DPX16_5375 [Anabarilius grahami]
MPEPTTDHETEPATIEKPELKPKPQITLELEPAASDQMSGPATSLVPVDLLIEHEGMTWSQPPQQALINCETLPALSHSSPLSLPDLPIVDPPWTVSSPVQSWSVYPLALPRTSRPITPPRPVKQSAPPWLLAFSNPPGTVVTTTPPGFHVPPASPWSACAMVFWAFSYVSSLHLHLSPPASWLHLDCLSLWLRPCPPGTLMSPSPISSSALAGSPAPSALSQSVVPLVPPVKSSPGLLPPLAPPWASSWWYSS